MVTLRPAYQVPAQSQYSPDTVSGSYLENF